MPVNEFEPDEIFGELNRKFANVSLDAPSLENVYKEIMFDDLYEYKDILEHSADYQACHNAMRNIRRYLTQDITLERIQNVFDLGLQEKMREILSNHGYDELKYETSWTITNLAYGTTEQTQNLIETGVIAALVHCFRSTSNFRVKSQSAWALANVSIESPNYRELMVQENLIGDVARTLSSKCEIIYNKLSSAINQEQFKKTETGQIIVQSKTDSDDVKDLTWSLANICRGGFKTAEHWEQYLAAFHAFSQCINFENQDIWTEACWGLSRILSNMYNYDPFFEALELNPGLCPRLVHLLKNQNMSVVLPALQTISNFSSGPNENIEVMLNADLLNSIWWYMTPDTHAQLRRNAILTISNLAAGSPQIVRRVVYNENIMQSVIAHVTAPGSTFDSREREWNTSSKAVVPDTKDEWRIVREALWVLSNIATLADDDCICALLRNHPKLIRALTSLLYYYHLNLHACLKIVDVLIRLVDRTNQITELTPPVYPVPRNPYAEEMVREGVVPALSILRSKLSSGELEQQCEILHTAIMCSSSHPEHQQQENVSASASAFGLSRYGIHLPAPDVRRIVHGFEDGDVRLIEDAIHSIKL